jgi:DNA modification methylase
MELSNLKPNKNNPRRISEHKLEQLKKSIHSFEKMLEARPIIVNKDFKILGGNMRYTALLDLGYDTIPDHWVKVVEFTKEEEREFIIKDNLGYGEWDWDILHIEWDVEDLEEWGLEIPDWTQENEDSKEIKEDEYEAHDDISTDIVLGDRFEIGGHVLLCGDATLIDSYKTLLGEEKADMMLTDPPYNVNYEGATKDKLKIANDSMSAESFYKFLLDFYKSSFEYLKNGSGVYIWHAPSEIINFAKSYVEAGFLLKQQLIWVKNQLVMGRQDYQWKHEPCIYGWKPGDSHNWYSDRKQTTVLEFNKPLRNGEHPTMKPIGLFGYQIQNSSKKGDIIIDPFGGSGTTMVAAHQLNRRGYLMEYDPKYCHVIIDRMIKFDDSLVIKRNGINETNKWLSNLDENKKQR